MFGVIRIVATGPGLTSFTAETVLSCVLLTVCSLIVLPLFLLSGLAFVVKCYIALLCQQTVQDRSGLVFAACKSMYQHPPQSRLPACSLCKM